MAVAVVLLLMWVGYADLLVVGWWSFVANITHSNGVWNFLISCNEAPREIKEE